MKIKLVAIFIVLAAAALQKASAQTDDLVHYVNTLQGSFSTPSLSYGNTYPTTGLPFAQHCYAAQTGKNGDGWKYQYQATTIRGFDQTHQCSPWMNDYATFSLMPVLGTLQVKEEERAAPFSHKNETAKPNYYSVQFNNGVKTEMAPVERGAHMRFSFPENGDAYIIFDGIKGNDSISIDTRNNTLAGWVHNGYFFPGSMKGYFIMQFDKPITGYGTWDKKGDNIMPNAASIAGEAAGAYLQFKKGSKVQVKIACSYISAEQALLSLNQELSAFSTLEQTKKAAGDTWNALLNRASVEGGTEEDKATYYSCLFRANLFSRKFYDIDKDGRPVYRSPYDSELHNGYMYTDNGFWDTFRAQFPLSNILHPEMEGRYMQSLLDAQKQCGWFPTWSNPGMSGGMLGNHAISLLCDAWVKGIHTFNPDSALAAYYHEATNKSPMGGSSGREGWKDYFTRGFIPLGEVHESAAKTLELCYDDWCAYHLAKLTGNRYYEMIFKRQLYNYTTLFDSTVGFMRGRLPNGDWIPNFNPKEWGGAFTEGNSWQYSWSVFHDVAGLIQLMGGEEKFNAKLDSLFNLAGNEVMVGSYGQMIHEMTEMVLSKMGQYAHGNQPDQHAPYLYNYSGQPWKTQQQVRAILSGLYNATEKGYPGDEDQGQMSSWYVISALGLYSVTPGTDQYNIGSPVFTKATLRLENGKTFIIEANNNSKDNVYIQWATLNGQPLDKNYITYSDIVHGGTLHLEMSPTPNKERGINEEARPYSYSPPWFLSHEPNKF